MIAFCGGGQGVTVPQTHANVLEQVRHDLLTALGSFKVCTVVFAVILVSTALVTAEVLTVWFTHSNRAEGAAAVASGGVLSLHWHQRAERRPSSGARDA